MPKRRSVKRNRNGENVDQQAVQNAAPSHASDAPLVNPPEPAFAAPAVVPIRSRYEGETNDACLPDGNGTFTTSSFRYVGAFQDGQRRGFGTLTRYDVGEYKGNFDANVQHGSGIFTYANGDVYDGNWENDKRHGKGKSTTGNEKYDGEWADGQQEGRGTQTWKIPDVEYTYEGVFHAGKRHGPGVLKVNDGQCIMTWDGTFKDDDRNGHFVITSSLDNQLYEGEVAQNVRSGHGKQSYADGSSYDGAWALDKRFGIGTLTKPNGDTLNGQWDDSVLIGNGTFTSADGQVVYKGQWANGNKNGKGLQKWPSGDTYDGDWRDDKKHGNGTYLWADGPTYVGDFRDGKRHGNGTFTWADGRTYVGDWGDDKMHGKGTQTWADGRTYVGDWRNGQKHGKGTFTTGDGSSTYVGDWHNGKMHGKGTETWADGRMYVGDWRDLEMHGKGTFTWADGRTYVGDWRNGLRHGSGEMTSVLPNVSTTVTKGLWKEGKVNGFGILSVQNSDGCITDQYEGMFKHSKYDGHGIIKLNSGDIFKGNFIDGCPDQGVHIRADKTVYHVSFNAFKLFYEMVGDIDKFTKSAQQLRAVGSAPAIDEIGVANFVNWESSGLGPHVLFEVNPGTEEYTVISKDFFRSAPAHYVISRIDRIENFPLHQAFVTACNNKMHTDPEFNPSKDIRMLYHGATESDALLSIVHDQSTGFNPLRTGLKTGRMWGHGVYFSGVAHYDNFRYASPAVTRDNRPMADMKQIIVAKVIVGKYKLGTNDRVDQSLANRTAACQLPLRQGSTHLRYDSFVNDEGNPVIFVIQNAAHIYPAYVVTFCPCVDLT